MGGFGGEAMSLLMHEMIFLVMHHVTAVASKRGL
jgi:hypothetical protein